MDPEREIAEIRDIFEKTVKSYFNLPIYNTAFSRKDRDYVVNVAKELKIKPLVWLAIKQLRENDINQNIRDINFPVNFNNLIGSMIWGAIVARDSGYHEQEQTDIASGLGQHDIGKVHNLFSVLYKEGQFNLFDRWEITNHTENGLHILDEAGERRKIVRDIVGKHQIWYLPPKRFSDLFRSYPSSEKNETIPDYVHLSTIADAVASMVDGKTAIYSKEKGAGTLIHSISELISCSKERVPGGGIHFNPELVPYFLKYLDRVPPH